MADAPNTITLVEEGPREEAPIPTGASSRRVRPAGPLPAVRETLHAA